MKMSLFLILWIVSSGAYAGEDWFNVSSDQIIEVGKIAGSVGGNGSGQLILTLKSTAPTPSYYGGGDHFLTGNKNTQEDNKQILAVLISAVTAGRSVRLCASEDDGNSQVSGRPYIKAAIILPQ